MAKVLITGGAGFIGSHIVDKLLDNNYKVVVVDNLSSGNKDNLPQNENLKFYLADINDKETEDIFASEKPDYIVHLAAQTSVTVSVKNPIEDARTNILGSINIIELSKKYNVKKFLTSSSAAVYGMPKYLPVDENHPTEPISQYGLSKLTMENYIKLSGIPYVIFRFSNAYGPRQCSSQESGVIAIFDKAMRNNEPVNIFGDGNQIRDFVYVEDIADVCVKVIMSDVENKTFNLSTNKGETVNDLFKMMKEIYGYKHDAIYMPERDGDIRDSILSNEKIRKSFSSDIFQTKLKDGIKILSA